MATEQGLHYFILQLLLTKEGYDKDIPFLILFYKKYRQKNLKVLACCFYEWVGARD